MKLSFAQAAKEDLVVCYFQPQDLSRRQQFLETALGDANSLVEAYIPETYDNPAFVSCLDINCR